MDVSENEYHINGPGSPMQQVPLSPQADVFLTQSSVHFDGHACARRAVADNRAHILLACDCLQAARKISNHIMINILIKDHQIIEQNTKSFCGQGGGRTQKIRILRLT